VIDVERIFNQNPPFPLLPRAPLTLFEGPATVIDDEGKAEIVARATATFDWFSGTQLVIEAETPAMAYRDLRVEVEGLELQGNMTTLKAASNFPIDASASGGYRSVSKIDRAIRGDISASISRLIVHLCNIEPVFLRGDDHSILVLDTDEWVIRIEEVEGARDAFQSVRLSGGGTVTHLLIVEREDGAEFTYDTADGVVEGVRHLASFTFGRRIAFLLPTGISAGGGSAFAIIGDPRRHNYTGGLPWFTNQYSRSLAMVWHGFSELWADYRWRDALIVAMELYVDAHSGLPVETRLVVAQAALELLSWQWLTHHTSLSHSEREDLKADGRLRRVLEGIGASNEIPGTLVPLRDALPSLDGPDAITRLRNSVAHPTAPDVILRGETAVRFDAWRLALWYFDLIVFNICGFEGHYLNRTHDLPISVWDVETPPWIGD